jgi:hypothetical protein
MHFITTVYITQKPSNLPNILQSHFDLGACTDGILMARRGDPGFCFIQWVNALYSPCGTPAPPSCSSCGAFSPWSVIPKFPNQKHVKKVKDIHQGMNFFLT